MPRSTLVQTAAGVRLLAALLGVQLGGINTYKGIVSNRALMGDPFCRLNDMTL